MMLSTGLAMEIHYCMGNRAGVDFYQLNNKKCSRCGMIEKENGCCNDEHVFYKIDDAHKNTSNNIHFQFAKAIYCLPITFQFDNKLIKRHQLVVKLTALPFIYSPPLFIRNRVFRI